MTDERRTDAEQAALDTVLAWLDRGGPGWRADPPPSWAVRPFHDAHLVCPVTRRRGGSIYVVRRGEVRHVLSNRFRTEEDVYRELAAEQG